MMSNSVFLVFFVILVAVPQAFAGGDSCGGYLSKINQVPKRIIIPVGPAIFKKLEFDIEENVKRFSNDHTGRSFTGHRVRVSVGERRKPWARFYEFQSFRTLKIADSITEVWNVGEKTTLDRATIASTVRNPNFGRACTEEGVAFSDHASLLHRDLIEGFVEASAEPLVESVLACLSGIGVCDVFIIRMTFPLNEGVQSFEMRGFVPHSLKHLNRALMVWIPYGPSGYKFLRRAVGTEVHSDGHLKRAISNHGIADLFY